MLSFIFFIATYLPRHSPRNTYEELPYPIFYLKMRAAKSIIYCYAFFFTYSTMNSFRSIRLFSFEGEDLLGFSGACYTFGASKGIRFSWTFYLGGEGCNIGYDRFSKWIEVYDWPISIRLVLFLG